MCNEWRHGLPAFLWDAWCQHKATAPSPAPLAPQLVWPSILPATYQQPSPAQSALCTALCPFHLTKAALPSSQHVLSILTPPNSAWPRTLPSNGPPTLSRPPRLSTAIDAALPALCNGAVPPLAAEVGRCGRWGGAAHARWSLPSSLLLLSGSGGGCGGAARSYLLPLARAPRPRSQPGEGSRAVGERGRLGCGAGRPQGDGGGLGAGAEASPPQASGPVPGSASEGCGLQPRPPPSRAPKRPSGSRGAGAGCALRCRGRCCGQAPGRPAAELGLARLAGQRKQLRRRAQGPGTARSAPVTAGSGLRGAPSAAVPLPATRALVPRRVAVRSRALVLLYFKTAGRRAALREGVPDRGSSARLCCADRFRAVDELFYPKVRFTKRFLVAFLVCR